MKIELHKVAKRYRYEWIFRNIDYTFLPGHRYAVLGPNGSGKSTLLNILSGHLTPSEGKIAFSSQNKNLDIDEVYRHIAYAAPYIDLIEELTLTEAIRFHQKFKPFLQKLTTENLIDLLGFQSSVDKEIKFFSSGMKQRLKLALAICSDTPLLFLDEPTTNLDTEGVDWYLQLINQFADNRLIIVASNVETDYTFCEYQLSILDFKH